MVLTPYLPLSKKRDEIKEGLTRRYLDAVGEDSGKQNQPLRGVSPFGAYFCVGAEMPWSSEISRVLIRCLCTQTCGEKHCSFNNTNHFKNNPIACCDFRHSLLCFKANGVFSPDHIGRDGRTCRLRRLKYEAAPVTALNRRNTPT